MADKLKTLIKTLPAMEPKKESVERLVIKIVKREMRRLWEKRISILTAVLATILSLFIVQQIIKMAEMLGTMGFWQLIIGDREWLATDIQGISLAFVEAHPLKEIASFILLLAILFFSFYIFLKSDE